MNTPARSCLHKLVAGMHSSQIKVELGLLQNLHSAGQSWQELLIKSLYFVSGHKNGLMQPNVSCFIKLELQSTQESGCAIVHVWHPN